MDETTTKKLDSILSGINDIREMEDYFQNPKVSDNYDSFLDYFKSLDKVRSLPDSDLIKLSGIEKSYYYQIMKGSKTPSRDKVLRLCIGAGLSYRETIRALEVSGNAILYSKNRRDIIITVAINQKQSVIDTNILLDKYSEEPLK